MKTIILVRYAEIFLKGANRPAFEGRLVKNIKRVLYGLGPIRIPRAQSRIYIEPDQENYPVEEAMETLSKVFGIASVSPVWKIETRQETLFEKSVEMVRHIISRYPHHTFKVETKRGDKTFPLNSMEVSRELGALILQEIPELKVDVIHPDFILYVEIREYTYLYSEIIPGVRGLPVGSNGRATLLISGGIDSPVAGWMIAKRGVQLEAVHFYSYPYTSERSRDKVLQLLKIMSKYTLGIKLHIVPFTEIQNAIHQQCPQEYLTIIMRRFMMKIAEKIAQQNGSLGLITGEAIGQVASQTMESLWVTDEAVTMPVYRPLIGMDKSEVIRLSKKIDTFETSILPYEDCCTVFVAKHPVTKPSLKRTLELESVLDLETLIEKALNETEILEIS